MKQQVVAKDLRVRIRMVFLGELICLKLQCNNNLLDMIQIVNSAILFLLFHGSGWELTWRGILMEFAMKGNT